MKTWGKNVVMVPVLLVLAGCGSTSSMRDGQSGKRTDLQGYDTVIIHSFTDGVSKAGKDEFLTEEGRRFSDMIARSLRQKKGFASVKRENVPGKAVVVSGKITEYEDGNAALRLLVGMGAGSSHFDAVVTISDNQTGRKLGNIDVDKHSWALGGGVAANQTAQTHMYAAADSIADELRKGKTGDTELSDESASKPKKRRKH